MLPYLNKTYCGFWKTCKHGDDCGKRLTPGVQEAAATMGVLVAKYADKPPCYERKTNA